ncbi:MAG TPA: purine-nucleoside phosphorylase [bacterium]|jgi:purine-nucleoside phosphorylase|nr:purine-nucleoside phosphorylase [bacterium]
MAELFDQIQESVKEIVKITQAKPKVGIILGTGLGALAHEIKDPTVIPYEKIPHFPLSTVESHAGELVFGKLGNTSVVAMKGRFHRYEGYTLQQVTFPVRVMKALGIKYLLVSNACGGMNRTYNPGDLMIIEDHVNLMGDNPLIGKNDDRLGPRWPDMVEPYSKELIAMAEKIAWEKRISVRKGVYVAVTGPNLETRAEYRWLSTFADVVGMSTVPEVIVAGHSGLKVLGISVVTDKCVADTLEPADILKIIRHAQEAEPKLTILMKEVAASLESE